MPACTPTFYLFWFHGSGQMFLSGAGRDQTGVNIDEEGCPVSLVSLEAVSVYLNPENVDSTEGQRSSYAHESTDSGQTYKKMLLNQFWSLTAAG